MWLLSPDEIERVREKRVGLEVRVAQAIGKCILDTCGHELVKAIRALLREIVQVPAGTLNRILAEKKENFAMFVSGNVLANELGMKLLKARHSLDLPVCSDIIRLFGELAEDSECKTLPNSNWAQHEIAKDDLKRAPTFLQPKDVEKKGWSFPLPAGKALAEAERGMTPEAKKEFEKRWKEEQLGIAHRTREDLQKKGEPFTRSESPYVEIPATIARGVDKHRFGDRSVVRALDLTFGARAKGADVSGTTTDSIYALRHAGRAEGLDHYLDLLMLLPIATMVPAGHHSMIECAYPLSRWGHQEKAPGERKGYIDYHIGYYDTLMPINCQGGQAELKTALGQFRSEADELHVLVYRDATGKEVGLLIDPRDYGEVSEFRKVAQLMSAYGWCVAGQPDRKLLGNVLATRSKPLKDELDRLAPAEAAAAGAGRR